MQILSLFNHQIQMIITDRSDGNMLTLGENPKRPSEKQNLVAQKLNLGMNQIARVNTHYGDNTNFNNYYKITPGNATNFALPLLGKVMMNDGLFTNMREQGLMLFLGDCLGIVFYDPTKKIFGLLHAGRHNLEQSGPKKFVQTLQKTCGCSPSDLQIYFSPCARSNYHITALNNQTVPEAARKQLISAGVLPQNIDEHEADTTTHPNFPSHSQGDKTERFAVAVKML